MHGTLLKTGLVDASSCKEALNGTASLMICAACACVLPLCRAQVNLKSELEAGWALRAGQQATALKEAQAKVAALEHSLQQVWALTSD
jgi:hypothetical protein